MSKAIAKGIETFIKMGYNSRTAANGIQVFQKTTAGIRHTVSFKGDKCYKDIVQKMQNQKIGSPIHDAQSRLVTTVNNSETGTKTTINSWLHRNAEGTFEHKYTIANQVGNTTNTGFKINYSGNTVFNSEGAHKIRDYELNFSHSRPDSSLTGWITNNYTRVEAKNWMRQNGEIANGISTNPNAYKYATGHSSLFIQG